MHRAALALCLAFGLSPAGPAAAAEERAEFDISVAGLRAGSLVMVGTERGGRYQVTGVGRSAGVVAGLVRLTVEASATGRVDGNRYRPASYTETVVERGETERARFVYSGGGLAITRDPPDDDREPHYVGPEGQADALDPMTGVWALLRDRPADLACDLAISTYNGAQRAGIRLSGGRREGDTLVCPGTYTREAGYSAEELAERRRWEFTMTYRDTGDDLLRLEEVRLRSEFGPMVFRRR
jgi:hypothetical protein